jgi:hypothetical protein
MSEPASDVAPATVEGDNRNRLSVQKSLSTLTDADFIFGSRLPPQTRRPSIHGAVLRWRGHPPALASPWDPSS